MRLSKRLQAIADMIHKYKQGNRIADIGSDHGYLPCYLVKNNIVSFAYACDISEGPCQNSKDTIKQFQLSDKVKVLCGDGLEPILDKHVDMISISGMGAYLIVEILEKHFDYLNQVEVLFLQANANVDHLRAYLFTHQFQIIDEQMIKDSGHIYEILTVVHVKNKAFVYNQNDIVFGPVLSTVQPPLFKEKWTKQYDVYKKIKTSLPLVHPRYQELDNQMKQIKEMLHEGL